MRVPEQVKRLAVVIAAVVIGVVLIRFYVIPRSLVATSMHRAAAIEREIAKPVKLAGSNTCQTCHDDEYVKKSKGFHKNLACEGCHGPAAQHAEDPMSVKPPAPRDRKFCPVCHAYDASRPTGFPQINPTVHNPAQALHRVPQSARPGAAPDAPGLLGLPRADRADEGRVEPRACSRARHATGSPSSTRRRRGPRCRPSPTTREFCAKCHGQDSPQKEPPKVDVSTHGGSYLCWQCHYPHLPEGRG